jgi:hypothetical protein
MSGFLATLNRLNGASGVENPDPEYVQRAVLQHLRAHPADLQSLAEFSMPMSAVHGALAQLQSLGLVEPVNGHPETYKLSDYAAKALTYITPA